jgi:DNA polymerase elongation subunit (family B)
LKILLLDIETAPNTGYFWGLYEQDINLEQIIETSYILCWSAKWLDDSAIVFERTPYAKRGGRGMLRSIHGLMEEADMIVTYNGNRFDIPTLNREFLINRFPPPAPSKQLDLYPIVKTKFRFASNKLDHVAQELGIGKKVEHYGFRMWVDCMHNLPNGWEAMEPYNRNDVVILEGLYKYMLAWLPNQGHAAMNEYDLVCTNCGGKKYHQRGFMHSLVGKYARFQCLDCHHWFRANVNELPKKTVKFV